MAKRDIKPRVRIPKRIKKGETFLVKTLVTHRMESGQRPDKETGAKIPREIINSLRATYNGDEVLNATWHPGVSANPYTSFYIVANKSGPLTLIWTDDNNVSYDKTVQVRVSG
jgi:sulfur-oxidizing protein SoxZ